ncbi:MAG: glycosyltransferase family 39 protein, partial [Candidatus Dormibacteraceae bacterium]
MLSRWVARSSVTDQVATPWRVPPLAFPDLSAARRWVLAHPETLWVIGILVVAGLAQGVNMLHFPYDETDEGTYMAQAWAVLHQGQLAPYTYWYDHAPLGWIQIALWTVLTGGFYTFGSAVDSGRVLMLGMQLGSVLMVYRIARRVSDSVLGATIAALTFSLSAYGIYYHRRVLLDNITT